MTLVLAGMTVLGLYNATMGTNANYVREDPPYLTRRLDILTVALLALGGLAGTVLGHLNGWLSVLSLPAYLLIATIFRAIARRRLRTMVDEVLNELRIRQVMRPIRSVARVDCGDSVMKRNKRARKPAKNPLQTKLMLYWPDQKNVVELALCHLAELISLAQGIACDMHSGMNHPEAILQVSGRLATLMHCAKRELEQARLSLQASHGTLQSTCSPPSS